MKYLLFPFFLGRLMIEVVFFMIKIALAGFSWSISLLLASCVLIFQCLFFLDQTLAIRQNFYQAALQALYKDRYQQRLTYLEIEWRRLFQQQPTHRDVLINLSLINGELGKKDQQSFFQKEALRVDPNFEQ